MTSFRPTTSTATIEQIRTSHPFSPLISNPTIGLTFLTSLGSMMAMAMVLAATVAATRLPPAAACRLRSPLSVPFKKPRILVASAHSNFSRVVQTAWRVGKDAVEAGTNLVPGSVPRPIARIGVTFSAVSVALFLLKSIVSTAFFVLAMVGLIYLGFLALNPKEVTGSSRADEAGGSPSEDPVEEARRIMEKYK